MKRLLIFITTICWVLNSYSQEFGTHWISYPLPNDSSEVLFRHTYLSTQRPRQASITFASTGNVRIYMNGRNVTRDVFLGNETICCSSSPKERCLFIRTYDVSRFLRTDSNTIAVAYLPTAGMPLGKQLSLAYDGIDHEGHAFHHQADGGWQCLSTHNTRTLFDNNSYENDWKESDTHNSGWIAPTGAFESVASERDSQSLSIQMVRPPYSYYGTKNMLLPLKENRGKSQTTYDFGRSFEGTIRITLRDARKGERIHINGFTYICSGDMDEQAYLRLACSRQRVVTITGDKNFKTSQIQNVEGLEYDTIPSQSYLYQ